jgi:hypothetical protein
MGPASSGPDSPRIRHEGVTHSCAVLCCNGRVKSGKPTVRQVYALAAALCERAGEEFPETRDAASELIERLRIENGHPAPRLEDAPFRPRRGRRAAGRDERDASRVAVELSREL